MSGAPIDENRYLLVGVYLAAGREHLTEVLLDAKKEKDSWLAGQQDLLNLPIDQSGRAGKKIVRFYLSNENFYISHFLHFQYPSILLVHVGGLGLVC